MGRNGAVWFGPIGGSAGAVAQATPCNIPLFSATLATAPKPPQTRFWAQKIPANSLYFVELAGILRGSPDWTRTSNPSINSRKPPPKTRGRMGAGAVRGQLGTYSASGHASFGREATRLFG